MALELGYLPLLAYLVGLSCALCSLFQVCEKAPGLGPSRSREFSLERTCL